MPRVFTSSKQRLCFTFLALSECFSRRIKPPTTSLARGTLADLPRGKSELLAENALLRHQLLILRRQIKRPVYRKTDRFLLVVLARLVRSWQDALFLVQEDDGSRDGIVSSSACSGNANQSRTQESRGSLLR